MKRGRRRRRRRWRWLPRRRQASERSLPRSLPERLRRSTRIQPSSEPASPTETHRSRGERSTGARASRRPPPSRWATRVTPRVRLPSPRCHSAGKRAAYRSSVAPARERSAAWGPNWECSAPEDAPSRPGRGIWAGKLLRRDRRGWGRWPRSPLGRRCARGSPMRPVGPRACLPEWPFAKRPGQPR